MGGCGCDTCRLFMEGMICGVSECRDQTRGDIAEVRVDVASELRNGQLTKKEERIVTIDMRTSIVSITSAP
jgi:hypothetical protein